MAAQGWAEATQEGAGVLRSLPFVLQRWGPLLDFKYHPQINVFPGHLACLARLLHPLASLLF